MVELITSLLQYLESVSPAHIPLTVCIARVVPTLGRQFSVFNFLIIVSMGSCRSLYKYNIKYTFFDDRIVNNSGGLASLLCHFFTTMYLYLHLSFEIEKCY